MGDELSKSADDIALLDRWCSGSHEAGDQLLRRCFGPLYRFFVNKVGDATDDLVQQTLVTCIKHRERMLEYGGFRSYLFRIARSRLYDYVRAQQRRENRIVPGVSNISQRPLSAASFTSIVAQDRATSAVLEALRQLPLDQQVVVELHYWEGLSTGEIGTFLDIAQGTVKSRLRRAREALEVSLSGSAPEVMERVGRARPDVGAIG